MLCYVVLCCVVLCCVVLCCVVLCCVVLWEFISFIICLLLFIDGVRIYFFPILPVHGISNHCVNFSPFYFSYPVLLFASSWSFLKAQGLDFSLETCGDWPTICKLWGTIIGITIHSNFILVPYWSTYSS